MPQVEISGGVVVLGSRTLLPGQARALTPAGTALTGPSIIQPLDVSIGTVSALALAEVLTSATVNMSGSVITKPGAQIFLSGVKQQMVVDAAIMGSGSILFSVYSLQPQIATLYPLNPEYAIDGTLLQTSWLQASSIPNSFRMFNDSSGNVPLSPLIEIAWEPVGSIVTYMTTTMTFR